MSTLVNAVKCRSCTNKHQQKEIFVVFTGECGSVLVWAGVVNIDAEKISVLLWVLILERVLLKYSIVFQLTPLIVFVVSNY